MKVAIASSPEQWPVRAPVQQGQVLSQSAADALAGIVPALASTLLRGILRCGTGGDPTSTIAGMNCRQSASSLNRDGFPGTAIGEVPHAQWILACDIVWRPIFPQRSKGISVNLTQQASDGSV
jgi:hypothetical protein